MEKASIGQLNSLADVIEIDKEARMRARSIIQVRR
jgi:hypothetical protein